MHEENRADFVEAGRLLADALEISTAQFELIRQALGLGRRRARYYVRVWEGFRNLDVEREVLLTVGWTKLQMIADVVSQKNVQAWVIFLMEHSVQDVRRAIDGKLPLEKLHTLMFYLSPADYEIVAAGLVRFGATHVTGGLMDKERALVSAMAHAQSDL